MEYHRAVEEFLTELQVMQYQPPIPLDEELLSDTDILNLLVDESANLYLNGLNLGALAYNQIWEDLPDEDGSAFKVEYRNLMRIGLRKAIIRTLYPALRQNGT